MNLPIDHICYRVVSVEDYERAKATLLQDHELLAETLINGRPIATFKLREPLLYGQRQIPLLELPSPKVGSPYPEGYEHAEFVIGRSPAEWITAYPALSWDTKGIQKSVNADARLLLPGGISVKYHEYPLDYVIRYLD